ncbi:MAG TPA: phosphoribosyltransferase family protein [Acidimicrobiales bacterium]|nr:phosphoribosyltransferase family protein [Acidimicrobiales bacterium]
MAFVDRIEAGRRLAGALEHLEAEDVVVLGLPRGGVPVALEVALALDAPLDVIVVRKLGVPFQPELAMGAIGEGGVQIVNDEVVHAAGVRRAELAVVEARERAELDRRARRFRGGRTPVHLDGRTVVVVDDGIATGSTARAACQVARAHGAARVVLAVPVAPPGWAERMGDDADEYVAVTTPSPFLAIGQFYDDFSPTTDEEVVECLDAAARHLDLDQPPHAAGGRREQDVTVMAGGTELAGHLTVPHAPSGVVLFAHGSGSSRHSPRNRFVAARLHDAGLATLLFDLLTPEEELDRANVFDIGLLAERLAGATAWVRSQDVLTGLPVGYFGASTGAAAALWAAAEPGADVAAVVSRGGRPDLAEDRLPSVSAPTLLVVGSRDDVVLALNRKAQVRLRCEHELAIVPRATHLFEEPGALESTARLATEWFAAHLVPAPRLVKGPTAPAS